MDGWIKLHRKIVSNPYYFSEIFTRSQAWVDLILIANHKEGFFYKRGIKVTVKRGEIGYDIESLASRWKWSRGKVERFLKDLEKSEQIVRQKTNITTLISIIRYDEYQGDDKSDSKADSKANDKANGQQMAKQTDTNKNDNNDKEDKYMLVFEEARKLYPGVKNGLEVEFKNFQKKNKDWKDILPKLKESIQSQINHRIKLKNSNASFIPSWKHFQTWINKKCWTEEYELNPKTDNRAGSTLTLDQVNDMF